MCSVDQAAGFMYMHERSIILQNPKSNIKIPLSDIFTEAKKIKKKTYTWHDYLNGEVHTLLPTLKPTVQVSKHEYSVYSLHTPTENVSLPVTNYSGLKSVMKKF